LEQEGRLLSRVASPEFAEALARVHHERGTRILTGVRVAGFRAGTDGRVAGVALADGNDVLCSLVLIAVGAMPDDEIARAAGLRCEGGVVVDAAARTDDPSIYAVGDVASRPVELLGEGLYRLESIPSTIEQARQAVASMTGGAPPAPEVPWFWSDQFDLKVQIAGLIRDVDQTIVRDEMPVRMSVLHLRRERLVAIESINATRDFVAARSMIRDAKMVDAAMLRDPEVSIPKLVKAPAAHVAVPLTPSVAARISGLPGPGGKSGEPRAIFIQPDGRTDTASIAAGMSLMEAAIRCNVPGIIAECGGTCSCGTCHVVIDEVWRDRLKDANFDETDLLEFLDNSQEGSRLGCQIVMTDELDGLVARVPPREG
jgi:3-phenylpropionate/trans-cinnamate dioxygenase ferredoxin reductase subunit